MSETTMTLRRTAADEFQELLNRFRGQMDGGEVQKANRLIESLRDEARSAA